MVSAATVTRWRGLRFSKLRGSRRRQGPGESPRRHLIDRIWLGPRLLTLKFQRTFWLFEKSSSLYDRLSQGRLGVIPLSVRKLEVYSSEGGKTSLPIWAPLRMPTWTQCVWQVSQGRASHFLFMGLSPAKDVRMNESFGMKPQQGVIMEDKTSLVIPVPNNEA